MQVIAQPGEKWKAYCVIYVFRRENGMSAGEKHRIEERQFLRG